MFGMPSIVEYIAIQIAAANPKMSPESVVKKAVALESVLRQSLNKRREQELKVSQRREALRKKVDAQIEMSVAPFKEAHQKAESAYRAETDRTKFPALLAATDAARRACEEKRTEITNRLYKKHKIGSF